MLSILIICLYSVQTGAQSQKNSNNGVDFPWVPRVSAYEAYTKYKSAKAIIFHAGGVGFNQRHILGAINFDFKPRERELQKFPKSGIEIFTYCY
jgi:hypothetical protein